MTTPGRGRHVATARTLPRRAVRRLRRCVPVTRLLGSVSSVATTRPWVALTFADRRPTTVRRSSTPSPDTGRKPPSSSSPSERRLTRHWRGRAVAEGHDVGLHGSDHARLPRLGVREVARRIIGGRRRLEAVVGRPIRWFRPPFGAQTVRSFAVAGLDGMEVVGWSASGRDWLERDPEGIVDDVMERVRPGAIVLLHDHVEVDQETPRPPPRFDRAAMVSLLLERLDARGLRPVTLSRLVGAGQPRRMTWFRR